MKLKNKKTGEINNWCIDKDVIRTCDGEIVYKSLAELNEEWEDYEEPKDHWFISDGAGHEVGIFASEKGLLPEIEEYRKEIGNYFETREEAEKAVEKLKAWKRLKDKGFRFTAINPGSRNIHFGMEASYYFVPDNVQDDLDLLFGGENECL